MVRHSNLAAISFLLLSLSHLGWSYQFPDFEYLKSLPEQYDTLLKDLACKDLTKRKQLDNCVTYMLSGKKHQELNIVMKMSLIH